MSKQRNDEQRQARFDKHWNRLDEDKSGELEYDEFKKFLIAYNKKEMPEKQYEFFFRGSDIDGGGSIDKGEMFKLVEALYKGDQLYINKLFFRAVDVDRSSEIDASEFVLMADLNGRKMSEEDAEKQIQKLTGGKHTLTFAQMHKALTGQELPADTDPYDGKNVKKAPEQAKPAPSTQPPAPSSQPPVSSSPPPASAAAPKPSNSNNNNNNNDNNKYQHEHENQNSNGGKKKPDNSNVSGLGKILLMVMIVLSSLAAVAMILSTASYFYLYDKTVKDSLKSFKAGADYCKLLSGKPKKACESQTSSKVVTGFSPKDAIAESVNGYWMYLMISIMPGILSALYIIIEALLVVSMVMQLIGKKLPFITELCYAPCTRGIFYVLFGIPTLGVSNDLGAATGIIMVIVGIAIIAVGIVEKILGSKKIPVAA